MYFLSNPLIVFKAIAKRPHLVDALSVVVSVWVLFIGSRLAQLAAQQALTATNFATALIEVTYMVFFGWLALAAIAYLLVTYAGSKTDYRTMLALSGLAAAPLAILGIVAIVLTAFMAGLEIGVGILPAVVAGLLWAGIIIGSPGLYLSLALRGGLGLRPNVAYGISTVLVLLVVLTYLLQEYIFIFSA